VTAFLDTVPCLYRDLYVVWFRTGWRPSEILAVRFDWLDVHRQTVLLRLGRIARWGGVEAPPRTGPREVDCSYDPEIFAAFERCRRAALATGNREYVFTDQTGQPLSQEWLHKRVWLPTLRRCGSTPVGSTTSATPSSRTPSPPAKIRAGWHRSAARPSR
jgi:hypothetical protein